MGDSGSLFLGFTLSFLALSVQKNMGNASVYIILVLPMAIMAMPILDTSLVTFKRLISGRKVYMGGRDHSSHRLVALGLTEKKAVLLLYGIALVWGLSAIFLINSVSFNTLVFCLSISSNSVFDIFSNSTLRVASSYTEDEPNVNLSSNIFLYVFNI
jgi:UDP-GlcNAc:undecaprenyl-phosphate GlcNAc-1-phosphate transferase